jgi:hypothetical protein
MPSKMHALEDGKAEEDVAAECLEAAAGIRTVIMQQRPPKTVRELRRDTPRPRIAPPDANPRHQRRRLAASKGQRQQTGNIICAVLPVAIHGHDPGCAGRHHPGHQRRGLAATPVVAQHADGAVRQAQRAQTLSGCVIAAIVDIDELEPAKRSRSAQDLLRHSGDVVLLIEDGNDDGEAGLAGHARFGRKRIC